MMYLISGQPGNGKTLRAMALALEEYERNSAAVKEGKEQPRRFFSNITNATRATNPKAFEWMERLPDHNDWRKLPDGAFVIYDEAHADGNTDELREYGLLFPATGRPGESDDDRIRSMSTHRKRGFDLVFVTQWPSKVHHNVRQLVGKHIHMNRAMGLQRAGVVTWTRVQSDPYDEAQREKAEEEIWAFPTGVYEAYQSATLHTASYKFKVPKKVWQALSMVIVMPLIGWLLWIYVFKPDVVPKPEGKGEAAIAGAPLGAGGPPPAGGRREEVRWKTAGDYAVAHLPRFPSMPWTAPVFDEREVQADPQLLCMAAGDGVDADGTAQERSCTCLTEQGTRYELPDGECRAIARHGAVYNPYKERGRGQVERGAGAPPAAMGASAPAPLPSAATVAGSQVSGYGDIGVALKPGPAP